MKISWNCLNELVDLTNINHLIVIQKLTLAGFEIENIKYHKTIQDITFDVNITANRSDIHSIIDIATEVSALLNKSLKTIPNIKQKTTEDLFIIKTLTISKYFNKFTFKPLKNIKLNLSCSDVHNYLLIYDLKPQNNILDIIKLINLKWGQNIKLYTIKQKAIKNIKKIYLEIKKNNKITEISKIHINDQPIVAINENHLNNKNINHDIILLNYELKNQNDSNNYISETYTLNAYKEIYDLIKKNSNQPINPSFIYMHSSHAKNKKNIYCRKNKIEQILGPINTSEKSKYLNKNNIINILKKLNFEVNQQNDFFQIIVPQKRQKDIQNATDIIEEIGRIYGFNQFYDQLPVFIKKNTGDKYIYILKKIRSILRSFGLHEIINYSLENNTNYNTIKIINPLNQDQKILRTNLINNMILAKAYNNKQANENFEAFEIGKIFKKNHLNQNYDETIHLAGLLGNQNYNHSMWNKKTNELSWFQAKGQLEELFERIYVKVEWTTDNFNDLSIMHIKKYIHPKRTIYIKYKNQTFGFLSQLNNKISKYFNFNHKIYIFELNISTLIQSINYKKNINYTYQPYSTYPKITRDISIKINTNISMALLNKIITKTKENYHHFIESIKILNEYYEKDKYKILSLRITYRSNKRTLTNQEIEILDDIFKNKLNSTIE